MEKKQAIFSAALVMRNGKLNFRHSKDRDAFKQFENSLAENQSVELHYSASLEEGTLTMLAKIHAAIRTLANEVGCTDQEMKDQVKRKGKYVNTDGTLKSFGDMDLKSLQGVFKVVCELGDFLNTNVR